MYNAIFFHFVNFQAKNRQEYQKFCDKVGIIQQKEIRKTREGDLYLQL